MSRGPYDYTGIGFQTKTYFLQTFDWEIAVHLSANVKPEQRLSL